MASALRRYAFTQARVRARVARLLERRQLEALATPADPARRLAELDALEAPGDTEALLAEFDLVLRLLEGAPREIVERYRARYELENLKVLTRALERGASVAETAPLLLPAGPLGAPDQAASWLARGSVAAFVEALPAEPFGDPLRRALRGGPTERFRLEAIAEREAWERTWRALDALAPDDRRSAWRVLGAKCDAVNLLRLLRLRVHHGLAPEEIVALAIRGGRCLGARERARLAHNEPQQWATELAHTPYAPSLTAWSDPAKLERELERVVARTAGRELAGSPFRIGLILAYLILLEIQTADLRRLREGARLGRSASWITQGLCVERAS